MTSSFERGNTSGIQLEKLTFSKDWRNGVSAQAFFVHPKEESGLFLSL
jgi:hypothetical protein